MEGKILHHKFFETYCDLQFTSDSIEWPLQLPSRLNPLDTGGKYCHKYLHGENLSNSHL